MDALRTGIQQYDDLMESEGASERLGQGQQRSLLLRILPEDVSKHISGLSEKPKTFEDLCTRVFKYIEGLESIAATRSTARGNSTQPMDIGAMSEPVAAQSDVMQTPQGDALSDPLRVPVPGLSLSSR